MEDKKYNYTMRWRQSYNTWPSKDWLDEAINTIIEAMLENDTDYPEARAVIKRIKSL